MRIAGSGVMDAEEEISKRTQLVVTGYGEMRCDALFRDGRGEAYRDGGMRNDEALMTNENGYRGDGCENGNFKTNPTWHNMLLE